MIRRADFLRLGGYHPSFFLYYDDVDICWRARLAGRQVRFVPGATIVHDYEFAKGSYKKWYWLERNRLWTVLSNYEARTLWLLLPLLAATEAATLLLATRDGWWREKLRAWTSIWRERDELLRWRSAVQKLRVVGDSELMRSHVAAIDTPLVAVPARSVVDALISAYARIVRTVLDRLG